MTARQRAFIEAYAGNATEAAKAAGYSDRTAYSQGQRLLKNVEIAAAIQEREEQHRNELIMNREERMITLTRIIRDNRQETRDRLRAIDLMCKANGDYLERIEAAQQGPIVFRWAGEEEKQIKKNLGGI